MSFLKLPGILADARRTGGVHLIRATPGTGKTRNTVQAVIDQLTAPDTPTPLRRVLWAVASTRGEEALAQEALAMFKELGAPHGLSDANIRIIQGRDAFKSLPSSEADLAYRAQFQWDEEPAVRIISHAHLPLLFGPHPLAKSHSLHALRTADLLVIDEDTLNSLVTSLPLSGEILKRLPDRSPLRQALQALLTNVPTQFPLADRHESPLLRAKRYDVHTTALFTRLHHHLNGCNPDWDALERALSPRRRKGRGPASDDTATLQRGQAKAAVSVFKEAYVASLTGTPRRNVSLHWVEARPDSTIGAQEPTLQIHIHQRPTFAMPTLVLDAYADENLAERLYGHPAQPVTLHTLDPSTPPKLPVHTTTVIKLDRNNIRGRRGTGHLQQALKEALNLAKHDRRKGGRPRKSGKGRARGKLLLLTYKDTCERVWDELDALMPGFPGVQVDVQHYFDARGKNKWDGNNVIALLPPELPASLKFETLSALFPLDTREEDEERERVRQHLEESELLQMLHRSRITRFPNDPPLLATFFEPDDTLGLLQTKSLQLRHSHRRHAKTVDKDDSLRSIVWEIETALGGIPRAVLEHLGVCEHRRTRRTSAGVTRWLTRFRSTRSVPNLIALRDRGVLHDGQPFKPYLDRSTLDRVMQHLGYEAQTIPAPAGHPELRVVYVKPGQDPEEAIRKLLNARTRRRS